MDTSPLIVSILIQMHGKVINFELDSKTFDFFNNVRLSCQAKGFVDYETSFKDEFMRVGNLQQSFTKDLTNPTYDLLKAQDGIIVDNITYDKALSIRVGEPSWSDYLRMPEFLLQGIYLLSIHQGDKLIFPNKDAKILNLLYLSNLNVLGELFKTKFPINKHISDASTRIPNQQIYINEEDDIKKSSMPENMKAIRIGEIRRQFYNFLYKWQLTLNGDKIDSIKLSTLVELVKLIIGKPCFINLLDYSCNSPSIYIPKEQKKYNNALEEGDIEMGINRTNYGGKRKRKTRKNKRKI